MQAHEFISGFELVIATFGQWPTFHDAEVRQLTLEVTGQRDSDPTAELVVHGWTMTNELDERGFYKLLNPSLIQFHFEGVADFAVDGLNHQNVLASLNLSLVGDVDPPLLRVDLEHCYGLSGGLTAKRAKVVSVQPHPPRSG
jgi:hypothetical protein